MKKLLAAVTVTGLLVGGAATTAWAAGLGGASGGSGGGSAGVVNAIAAAGTQRIDQAAARGTIDASKADQAKQKLRDFANRFVNEAKPTNGSGRGYGLRKDAVQAGAKEIGVSTDDLKQALKDGKTVAQVAKDHDKSVDDVVNAIVKEAKSDIDQAVKDGKLDSRRADELESKLPDHVKLFVNGERKQAPQTTETTGATQS